MNIGVYVIKEKNGIEVGYVSERCPACNSGSKVGGSRSPVMACPICKGTRVVFTQVPLQEAVDWIDKQRRLAEHIGDSEYPDVVGGMDDYVSIE